MPLLTEIGHVCREAVQEFAESLAIRRGVVADTGEAQTVERIRNVLNSCRHFSKTEREFLKALLAYWGTVIDLIERQEHGAAKEGEQLVWEDARRLVFQTANVMYEIDRSAERSA